MTARTVFSLPNISLPFQFISCDVIGVFSYLFCDFGAQFVVNDSDGEEYKEVFIGNISKVSQLDVCNKPFVVLNACLIGLITSSCNSRYAPLNIT